MASSVRSSKLHMLRTMQSDSTCGAQDDLRFGPPAEARRQISAIHHGVSALRGASDGIGRSVYLLDCEARGDLRLGCEDGRLVAYPRLVDCTTVM